MFQWECGQVAITGVESIPMGSIRIYPNPAREIVTIEYAKQNSDARVYVYDMMGRVLKITTVTSDKTVIDISRLQSGVYYVQVRDDGVVVASEKVCVMGG